MRASAPLAFVTGVLFLLCWILFPAAKAACGCVLVLGLVGASAIDLRHMIIPDIFTLGLAAAGFALSILAPSLHGSGSFLFVNCARSAAAALLGVAIGSALALWLGLIGELVLHKEVLGFGDVKLVGAIGAFCGWQGAVFSVFGGAAIGAVALVVVAARGRFGPGGPTRASWGAHFPFGPMLAGGAGLYFFALHPLVDRYLAQYLVLF